MRIDNGLEMLEVKAAMMGRTETVYPTLLHDDRHMILVDTGYPGQWPLIRGEIEKAGLRTGALNKLIITHQDIDHIGSLPAILEELPEVEVLADPTEKPYIQGDLRLLKITDEAIDQAVKSLPPEVPDEWRAAFRRTLENPPKGRVDTVARDGEELPFCGGILVIGTPGHTPGHISLYHKSSKTLIAVDAMIVENGRLRVSPPEWCTDPAQAKLSLNRLALYDIEKVICYHGGLFEGDCNRAIAELARSS